MKREKENQIILAKRRTWMISFSFGQLSFPLQYRSLRFSSISNNFSFRDSLKYFFALFLEFHNSNVFSNVAVFTENETKVVR